MEQLHWNTAWNDLVPNPVMAGQVFDSSGFNMVDQVLSKLKEDISVGTAQLELINSYNISAGDNFVRSNNNLQKILGQLQLQIYDIGLELEMIMLGGTDSPTIVRGNLVSGASFQQLTLMTQPIFSSTYFNSRRRYFIFYFTSSQMQIVRMMVMITVI